MTPSQAAQEPCTIGQPHPECRYANGGFRLDPAEWHCAREAAQEKPTSLRTEAGRTLRGFACWEFHAFSVDAHNASCGRTLELILAIEREAAAATPPLDVPLAEAADALSRAALQARKQYGDPYTIRDMLRVLPDFGYTVARLDEGSDSLTFLALSQHLDHHTPMAAVRTFPRIDCRCGWEGFDWPVHFYGSTLARLDEGSATPREQKR